jgi:deoxyribonuclease I
MKLFIAVLFSFCSITISSVSLANQSNYQKFYPDYKDVSNYYGEDFSLIDAMSPGEVRKYINRLLNSAHIREDYKADKIVLTCKGNTSDAKKCYPVKHLSYSEVRKQLFGRVHLEKDRDGQFFVNPIYCDKKVTAGVGPGLLPSMGTSGLNTEHVFPKAHFKRSRNGQRYGEMKTDIHHLAPSIANVNSFRGSFHFGYPNSSIKSVDGCGESVRGTGAARRGSQIVFLPRAEVRGDVARMVMYFSIRFDVAIQNVEEGMLRQWHESDPVDEKEYERNNRRYSVQGNRNPFIDFPGLVQYIQDF